MCGAPARAESASTTCDKVASPQGSDSAPGTVAAPLRTVQALANALSPGQVGCLRAGNYEGGLRVNHGGTSEAPLVLRSYPGERAQVTGRLYVPHGSDYVTIADLKLDGSHQPNEGVLPSPTVDASHTTFEADDVTNEHTAICFDLGNPDYGMAESVAILANDIHDCGVMPANNHEHGIYVADAINTRIIGNVIAHNADRGIQLYPYSEGAVIEDNAIVENGEGIIFSGAEGVASDNNIVEHNLVADSLVRHDIESWYPEGNPIGTGNIAQENCVSGAHESPNIATEEGFKAANNVTAAPSEIVATESGYGVAPGSVCAGVVPQLVLGVKGQEAPSGGGPAGGKESGGGSAPPVSPPGSPPTSPPSRHWQWHAFSVQAQIPTAHASQAKRRHSRRKAHAKRSRAAAHRRHRSHGASTHKPPAKRR